MVGTMRRVAVFLVALLVLEPALSVPVLPVQSTGSNGPLALGSERTVAWLSDLLFVDSMLRVCAATHANTALCSELRNDATVRQFLGATGPVLALPKLVVALRVWRSLRNDSDMRAASCIIDSAQHFNLKASREDIAKEIMASATGCVAPGLDNDDAASFLQFDTAGAGRFTIEKLGFHPNTMRIAVYLLMAVFGGFVTAVLIGKFWGGWSLRPVGWETSAQTKVSIVGVWLSYVSVITLVVLTVSVKAYKIYRAARRASEFHAPFEAAGSADTHIATLASFAVENSLVTFLEAERSNVGVLGKDSCRDDSAASRARLSFEEWNSVELDTERPDPLRLLVKYFFVDDFALKALAKEGKQFKAADDPLALLHKVYEFRELCFKREVAHDEMSLGGNYEKARADHNRFRDEVQKAETELKQLLEPAWENMWRKLNFDDEAGTVNDALEATESWGSTLLALGMVVAQVYSFLDKSPECPPLNKPDLTILTTQTVMRGDFVEAPLPFTHDALRWTCTHGATANVEEGGRCSLMCNPGYTAMFGATVCDSLGGAGMAWTHLNQGVARVGDGQSLLDLASCCVSGSDAATLSKFKVELDGSTAKFAWSETVGFAHACGTKQAVFVEACAYNPADLTGPMTPSFACTQLCLREDSGKCLRGKAADGFLPSAEWAAIDDSKSEGHAKLTADYATMLSYANAEHSEGAPIGSVEGIPTPSAALKLLYRVGVENRFGKFFGPWKA